LEWIAFGLILSWRLHHTSSANSTVSGAVVVIGRREIERAEMRAEWLEKWLRGYAV
jgi:hypothetical protein